MYLCRRATQSVAVRWAITPCRLLSLILLFRKGECLAFCHIIVMCQLFYFTSGNSFAFLHLPTDYYFFFQFVICHLIVILTLVNCLSFRLLSLIIVLTFYHRIIASKNVNWLSFWQLSTDRHFKYCQLIGNSKIVYLTLLFKIYNCLLTPDRHFNICKTDRRFDNC